MKEKNVFAVFGGAVAGFFRSLVGGVAGFFRRFAEGDGAVKASYLIMGFGNVARGQVIKGLLYFGTQIVYWFFIFGFAWNYLKDFNTLGTSTQDRIFNEELQIYEYVAGDNSILILLFSVVAIAVTLAGLAIYIINTKALTKLSSLKKPGKNFLRFARMLRSLWIKNSISLFWRFLCWGWRFLPFCPRFL